MVKQLYSLPLHIRARYKDQLAIEYEGLTLRYATRSPIAKRWFYPRYIGGTRLHEPPIAALIRSELDSTSTFFDVGANLGFFTVLAANICTGPEGSVHAFELDPALIPLIEDSLRLNKGRGTVRLNCVACADETGRFQAFQAVQEANPSTNQVILSTSERRNTEVQAMTLTLDHYYRSTDAAPDLVKMDIEGAEALAVPGMLSLVAEAMPKLILEVHPEDVRELGGSPLELIEQLREAGGYNTVQQVESYRNEVTHRDQVLFPLDPSAFEGDRPVVAFFAP
jgi:FkbM family methyltransferase